MNKISNAQRAEVMADAAATLRAQAEKIAQLESEKSARHTHDRAVKVAAEMHRKGVNLDTPTDILVDRLEKAAEQNKLDTIEEAIGMVAPDMGTKIAQLTGDEQRVSLGTSDLERFLIGATG